MRNILFVLIFSIFFSSCGDLYTKFKEDKEESFGQFASCELDMDAFSYILEKNIKGDIICLGDKLDLFIDTVESDQPGTITKKTLKKFIEEGPIEVDQDMVVLIDAVFELSHLIIGSDREFITRGDLNVLLDFMVFFNEHIWRSYKYFNSKDSVDYYRHIKERKIIFDEFTLISRKLNKIFKRNREADSMLDLHEFLGNFFFREPETLRKISSMLFMKRIFVGGSNDYLSHTEFEYALDLIPYLAQVAFDMTRIENFTFDDRQDDLVKILRNDLETIQSALYFSPNDPTSVFELNDLINAVLTFVEPDDLPFEIEEYTKEFLLIKDILLGSKSEYFSSIEINTFIEHGKKMLAEADVFFRVYEANKFELDSTAPISRDFSDFPASSEEERLFVEHFAKIVNGYKFMKGSFTSPTYAFSYHRNANAIFEIGVIEYLIAEIMSYYGTEDIRARGGVHMDLDQTVKLIYDFRWFLKDQGIITIGRKGGGEVLNVADNFVLMSTLFQFQSDGCDDICMEVPEATEFAISLLTAIEVKDFFTDAMLEICHDHLDEYDRIAPSCFRKNFIKVIEKTIPEEGRSLADYMPLFYDYLQEISANDNGDITTAPDYMKFIQETEAFTRSCMYYDKEKTEEVYLKGNDAFAVFAGLLNVESTLLRFDLNQNNKVDAWNGNTNEVLNAYYSTYQGAVTALVQGQLGNDTLGRYLSRPIFQYLVKYGTVPDTEQFSSIWQFVKFILKRNKAADISRTTVASILKTLGEQSENAVLHPNKCDECWRNPEVECLPEAGDDTWSSR